MTYVLYQRAAEVAVVELAGFGRTSRLQTSCQRPVYPVVQLGFVAAAFQTHRR